MRAKPTALREVRENARRELAALEAQREQLAELKSNRAVVMERYAEMIPQELDALALEERHHLYKMLRIEVVSNVDRSLLVSGALADTLEDEFRQLETVSR
jgi:hypothetical protein